MQSGGSGSGSPLTSYRPMGRSSARACLALGGLAVLIITGAAAPPPLPVAPPQTATEVTVKPAAAAAPDAAAAATNPLASFDLFGALIGMGTYHTAFTAVTDGVASAAMGALGLATAAGAAAGLVWAGYGPGDENTNYWNLVPAGLGALGGIAVGEAVAAGLLGYSPFGVGVAGYVPITSLTFSRYAHGAYAYMTAILGAKAALALYGVERPDDTHRDSATPAPAPAAAPPQPPPPPSTPGQPRPGEHGA